MTKEENDRRYWDKILPGIWGAPEDNPYRKIAERNVQGEITLRQAIGLWTEVNQ